MSEPLNTVDPTTDDLDAFSDLFAGRATEAKEEPKEDNAAIEEGEPLATEQVETEAETDDLEQKVDEDEEDKSLLKVKPKKTAKERITELTAKAHEAERREAETARRLAELEARISKPAEETPAAVKVADPEAPSADAVDKDGQPKYPLGEFDPNFIADLTRHTIRKETEAIRKRDAEEAAAKAQEQEVASRQAAWAEKLTDAETRLPDLREKGQTLEASFANIDPQYGQYLASTIMSMEHGPDVLYYLSTNLAEAQKIAASGPLQATLALGRIEAKFASHEEAKEPKLSKAPPPPPVNTKGNKGSREIPDDTDDLDAFSDKFFQRKR